MKYTEEENETIEQAKSNLLRGNDIESATLILEKVILDGMIIKCGRINILKVAARQIINFIEEYKNKEYLDVVREKVYANEESRRKDELIEKQQKEIYRLENKEYMKLENDNREWKKELNEKDKSDIEFSINDIRSGKKLLSKALSDYIDLLSKEIKLQCISGYTIDHIIELFLNGFVFVNEEKIKRLKGIEEDYIRRMKTSNKVLLKQGYVPIEKYNELLNSKVGVDLVYDDYISKEAIREKIKAKELQKEFAETIDDRIHLDGEIYILKELLGE